jgi:hypothetical protein
MDERAPKSEHKADNRRFCPPTDPNSGLVDVARRAGLALYHGENIPATWSAAFNKAVFGYPIELDDLESAGDSLRAAVSL